MEFRDFPEALDYWSLEQPHDPWLFERDGHDWQWGSWLEGARQLRRLRSRLNADLNGRVVGFHCRADPTCWVLDLAIQAAGGISFPVLEEDDPTATPEICDNAMGDYETFDYWVCPSREDFVPAGLSGSVSVLEPFQASVSQPSSRSASQALVAVQPTPAEVSVSHGQSGGSVCDRPAVERRRLSAGALLNRSAELATRLGEARRRDVLVFHGALDSIGERITWAWAMALGAAAVLEPQPERWALSVAWARPTIVQGSAEELVELRRGLEVLIGPWFKRRFRRRMSRLRGVLVFGRQALEGFEDRDLWESLGVRVVAMD